MPKRKIRPGALDEIAQGIGANSDQELAEFLGVTTKDLESIRYQGIDMVQAADILRRREAHLRAAQLLDSCDLVAREPVKREGA